MADGYSYQREHAHGCGCADPLNHGHMPECPRFGQTCEGCGATPTRENAEGGPLCETCWLSAPLAEDATPTPEAPHA